MCSLRAQVGAAFQQALRRLPARRGGLARQRIDRRFGQRKRLWNVTGQNGDTAHISGVFRSYGGAFGFRCGQLHFRLVHFIAADMSRLKTPFDVAHHPPQSGNGLVGGFQTALCRTRFEIIVGNIARHQHLRAIRQLLLSERSITGGIGIASFLAENIRLPRSGQPAVHTGACGLDGIAV